MHYITKSVIHGHHVSKDYFTPFIGRILSCHKKEGMHLLQRTYFNLFIGGEVFVRPTIVATSACVTTWHMTIIFHFQLLLPCL